MLMMLALPDRLGVLYDLSQPRILYLLDIEQSRWMAKAVPLGFAELCGSAEDSPPNQGVWPGPVAAARQHGSGML